MKDPTPAFLRQLFACIAVLLLMLAAQWTVVAWSWPGWLGTVGIVAGVGAMVWVTGERRKG